MPTRSTHFGGLSDKLAAWAAFSISTVCILIIGFILFFLVRESLPVLRAATISDLLFGMYWFPQEDPPALGMFPLITASLAVTFLAALIGLPVSLALAIFTAEIAPYGLRNLIKPLMELLGFIPSIVYGFLGMALVAPWLQEHLKLLTGLNMTNAAMFLGIMMIPIVGTLVDEALASVPQELRAASYALGATRWETISKIVIPGALPGILSASLLGVMRVAGDTMVVLMVAGGAAIIPESLFDPVRPLTSTIAAEMGETPVGSIHYNALFFAGLILLVIKMTLNLLSSWIESKSFNARDGGNL